MSDSSASYYRYWGKAQPIGDTKGAAYHLLVYHCLDVAAVGRLLLDPQRVLCKSLAARLKVDPTWLRDWFTFCLLLHDLGKFCRSFQNLARDLSDRLVPYEPEFLDKKRHDSLGFTLWRKLSASLDDLDLPGVSQQWLEIVCGHHGRPPDKSITTLRWYALPEDQQAAASFVRDCAQKVALLPDLAPLAQIDEKVFRSVSWQLAGVSVLADWLGSDQKVFCYFDEEMSLLEYWERHALSGAKEVVAAAGFIQKPIQAFKGVKQQFNFREPTPLQAYAETVPLDEPQHLFLLEDVTGAGKTEAAMVIVHRLLEAGLANGVYIGLPTMATANAMYKRMSDVYHHLYEQGSQPSLILAHGGRNLSELFTESVGLSKQEKDKDYDQDDCSASTYCNQWLADNRKKALLADVGVGTIDQALLGVLPARHQSLRLLGLSNKVLLVDEVHAYDPYMLALLTTLLKTHASQGGSAILLSATVPFQLRKKLVAAYAEGIGLKTAELKSRDAYPLVTLLNSSGPCETPVETRKAVRRTVKVERLADEEEAFVRIRRSIEQGQCVCWVRNTVKDARKAYSHLLNQEWVDSRKATLFHSRFAMVDRQRIEADVHRRFDDESDSDARAGRVLIATQVVEQSLDLDFDVMISDLAPIELLIQRAGRLQRHVRSRTGKRMPDNAQEQRASPCFYLLSPDPQQVDDGDWLKQLLPGTQAIYPHVGQLWLTARALFQQQGFSMPDDARPLVEGVYGERVQDEIPSVLSEQSHRAQGEQRAESSMGEFNQLQLDKGYTWLSAGQSGGWHEDVHVSTRLMKTPTATVALAKYIEGNLVPYAEDVEHGWAFSQVSVPLKEWEAVERRLPESSRSEVERLKRETPALRWVEVLPLIEPIGSVYNPKDGWNTEISPANTGNDV